jgi:riboflavin synthase
MPVEGVVFWECFVGPVWAMSGNMFTGLVEETGRVVSFEKKPGASRLVLQTAVLGAQCVVGESIAVNGCCLTVAEPPRDGRLVFDLLGETLRRTNLGGEGVGGLVNLERALLADGRVGGHFVQGHVDCVAAVRAWEPVGLDYRLEIELPREFAKLIVPKGSIAVDGISLTVADLGEESITIWIIPHTRKMTNLGGDGPGKSVNLEFDVLGKYVDRILALRGS